MDQGGTGPNRDMLVGFLNSILLLWVCVALAEPLIATHGASQVLTDKLFAQDGERVMMLLGSDDLGGIF